MSAHNTPDQRSSRARASILERFIGKKVIHESLVEHLDVLGSQERPRESLIGYIRRRYAPIFEANGEALEEIAKRLASLERGEADELAVAATSLLRSKLLSTIPKALLLDRCIEQESIDRQEFVKAHGFLVLDDIFSYDLWEQEARLHIAPCRAESLKSFTRRFVVAMGLLHQRIDRVGIVDYITATSWLIARAPRLVKNLAFTIVEPITQEERLRWFPGDKRRILKAKMPFAVFGRHYGPTNTK